jgi:phospholipase C
MEIMKCFQKLLSGSLSVLLTFVAVGVTPGTALAKDPPAAATPIQHVIVVFGENRSFDHVFGTFVPEPGQIVWNLLSQGIVNSDGTPGPNYDKAQQYSASNTATYNISSTDKTLYPTLPDPLAGGDPTCSDTSGEPFCTEAVAVSYEPSLDPNFNQYLIQGATGVPKGTPDTRIPGVVTTAPYFSTLPPGPFELTGGTLTYHDYTASPVHRFYQMWQETDCSTANVNFFNFFYNPSGCASDLFPWVELTIGAGSNGSTQSPTFNNLSTGEGSASMGFYNVSTGDVPYLTQLANDYTLLDNMHQSIMGGTGPNHIALGYADAMWYQNSTTTPPNTPPTNQIEDPNPAIGTNNWYAQDGYSGGSYTECADSTQPGVVPIVDYLASLPSPIKPNCDAGHFYLLNNYNPGYNGDGTLATPLSQFTIPPTTQPHIGDVLGAAGLTYTFFGEDWNIYAGVNLANNQPNPKNSDSAGVNPRDAYCNICNPFQYATDIMTSPTQIAAHIADMTGPFGFYAQVAQGTLPNVSIIQPSGFADGHPASSKIDIWEGFVKQIIESVQANKELWASTAIILIFDEGGGYYDSGYIQPLDFFGDGTRMPSLIISPYTEGGNVYHGYADHVSIDKFIEKNWNLPTISNRSRDNLPNPQTASDNPYVPLNSPAIDDLMGAFNFNKPTSSLSLMPLPWVPLVTEVLRPASR